MGKLNDQFLRRSAEINQRQSVNNQIPTITPGMYKAVSGYRRELLEQEVEAGLFKEGNSSPQTNKNGLTVAGNVLGYGLGKTAQHAPIPAATAGWKGTNDTARMVPEVYSPLWLNSNLNLPRDRATINAWCRSFYALKPYVQNAINLHSTYPISKLTIKCPNRKIEQFFNQMIEEIDLLNVCINVAQEFWLLGEAFIYAELDQRTAKWSRLVIQNPDYVVVKRSVLANEPLIMLRPDENLRRIVFSNKPADIEQKNQLNETIIDHIKRGENIPLDNFYVSHLARRISPYEVRGTGLPVCCFRELMIMDQIREAKFVQTQSMINPLTLVKIGGPDYKPSFGDLEAWRNTFSEAEFDRNFKIFTHEGVTVERIGFNQGILDTSGDVTQLLKEIYTGLMVPSVIMDGGGDITYQNGGVSLDVLRQRYMYFRNMMGAWLKKKIFAPISKLNDFYEYEDGEKKLIIPEVDWNHMSLFDTSDYINILVNLNQGDQKKVSHQTLYRSLGLEYEEERRKMKKEDISEAIRKKELMSLDRMALNDLRSLNDEDEIPEITESPLPGESPYTDVNSSLPGAGGGMGMGELPPLPGNLGGGSPMPPPPSMSAPPSIPK